MLKDSLISALIAAVGALLIWLFTKSYWCIVPGVLLFVAMYFLLERKRQHEVREKSDEEAKARPGQVLRELQEYVDRLDTYDERVVNEDIRGQILRIQKTLGDILAFLRDHPDKLSRVRGLHSHYLPDLLQALDVYIRAQDYAFFDEQKLVSYLSAMNTAFENLLRQLLQDSITNLESIMSVAMQLLEESGLTQPVAGGQAE